MADQADKKPKIKAKGFKPAGLLIKKAHEEPTIAELQTDITSFVETEEPEVARPRMFGRTPKLNTTRRQTFPKPASALVKPKPVGEAVAKPVAERTTKPVAEAVAKPVKERTTKPVAEPVSKSVMETVAKPAMEPIADEAESLLPPVPQPIRKIKKKERVDPELLMLEEQIEEYEQQTPYIGEEEKAFIPEDRKGFMQFILSNYKSFVLPMSLEKKINPDACKTADKLQTYKYQAFVREYMRQSSPYRGVLVYHGLGSGKTCTSIAASEALYNQSHKKIIVMTPKALKENFLDQLMFCGFRHYRLKNYWVSFGLTNTATQLFARNVVGISETLLQQILKRPVERQVIWMPDLERKEDESNYDTLEDWERSAIREQIYDVLNNKIEFIAYTGYTYKNLMDKVMRKTDFDNAVIIIDEIHNLTRLMAGKLDKYFKFPKLIRPEEYQDLVAAGKHISSDMLKKIGKYEPVGIDPWEPTFQAKTDYDRAFLFYRLLSQAKNSKIIALSGTPIVNKPVEIGILANILHGYFHAVEDTLQSKSDKHAEQLKSILDQHPRVNFYDIQKAEDGHSVFFTILEEGYVKVFDESTQKFVGVMHVGAEEATPTTIRELYSDVYNLSKEKGLVLSNQPNFRAIPLMPPVLEEFNNTFVDDRTLSVKNNITFVKRMSGLVSYYRGSREELMPKITKDVLIECPLSAVALPQYEEARLLEIEIDKEQKKRQKKPSTLQEGYELDSKESSSYRFRSRAVCNFAFPTNVPRPFPQKKKDLEKAIGNVDALLGDTTTDITENANAVQEAEEAANVLREEEEAEAEGEGEGDEMELVAARALKTATTKEVIPYEKRLAAALQYFRENKKNLFKMDPSAKDDQQLKTYSSKFSEIYKRIQESRGTSLVYSNFKTVEGIGILGYALEANGFMQIGLTGPENNRDLDEATKESFLKNPTQPRFILYSGDQDIKDRQILINLFNGRLNKLPSKIAQVLRESKLDATENKKGEICRAFMITGAGAEGLSLRNVRTVHIMEPYWNKVRTDQVKGRAVRICSHADLPYSDDPEKNERTVEVYTYIAVFDPKLPINETIRNNDNMKTSDEYILDLADAKEKINSNMLYLMKAGAVDCILNKAENEKEIRCYVREGDSSEFLYDPRLNKDIEKTDEEIRVQGDAGIKEPEKTKEAEKQKVEAKAPQKATVIEYGPPSKKIKYYMVAEGEKMVLYAKSDQDTRAVDISNIMGAKPVGEVKTDPATGKKSVKLY